MRIEAHNKFGKPIIAEITRLVVYDKLGNPIVVALDPGDGSIIAATADNDPRRNAEFHSILHSFGINQTIVVSTFAEVPVTSLRFPKD